MFREADRVEKLLKMLKLLKFSIILSVVCSHVVTMTFASTHTSYRRNDSSELTTNDTTENVVSLYSFKWLQLPRLERYIPTVMRRRSQNNKNLIQKSIYFQYYKNGILLSKTSPGMDNQMELSYIIGECGNEKTAFILHGWSESCETNWVVKLMDRLTVYRGGCIVCIDYGEWSRRPYLDLVRRFNAISQILYEEFLVLIRMGLNPKTGFMFGFSYGGRLATKIGNLLRRPDKFQQIDICDIAGPGFDYLSRSNHHEAADMVRCYYSSIDKGSQFRNCHQNIMLGYCGYRQPAILSQPYFSSHGLCVQIYINAFDYPFYALKHPPAWCAAANPVKHVPQGYTIGYDGGSNNITRFLTGDLFVPTGMNYPYNLSKRELMLYEQYLNEM